MISSRKSRSLNYALILSAAAEKLEAGEVYALAPTPLPPIKLPPIPETPPASERPDVSETPAIPDKDKKIITDAERMIAEAVRDISDSRQRLLKTFTALTNLRSSWEGKSKESTQAIEGFLKFFSKIDSNLNALVNSLTSVTGDLLNMESPSAPEEQTQKKV